LNGLLGQYLDQLLRSTSIANHSADLMIRGSDLDRSPGGVRKVKSFGAAPPGFALALACHEPERPLDNPIL